ncbi:hypothetical protein Tco_1246945 [Tanacetum coccineum]
MVAFLKKPNESVGFTKVVDFLKVASIDSIEYTITEASIRSKLQLADATRIHNLSDAEIYAGLATLGYVTEGPKSGGWDQFGSTVAISLISLSSNRVQLWIKVKDQHNQLNPIPHLSYEAPLPEGNTSGSAEASIQLKELMVLVPSLVTRVTSLEKELKDTKQTLGNVVPLIEGEEPEDQWRIIQYINDDPLVSLVRESMKEKSTNFINTELDAEDEINTGRVEINSGIKDVNTGSSKVDTGRTSISTSSIIHSPKKGQREEKGQMVEEDIQATPKTKEQIRQEEAGLEEAIRLQAQLD